MSVNDCVSFNRADVPYLVITEQCEINARNHRNGDIELRARQAVELLHGECCLLEVRSCRGTSTRRCLKNAKRKEKHG
jgi:hypothetical protein